MVIPIVIEWKGGAVGWHAFTRLENGTEVTINRGHTLTTVRRRMRRALVEQGIKKPQLEEEFRIPKSIEADLSSLQALQAERPKLDSKIIDRRLHVAQRLLIELKFSEREAAEWLGISHTHLANQLQASSTDTEVRVRSTGRKARSG